MVEILVAASTQTLRLVGGSDGWIGVEEVCHIFIPIRLNRGGIKETIFPLTPALGVR